MGVGVNPRPQPGDHRLKPEVHPRWIATEHMPPAQRYLFERLRRAEERIETLEADRRGKQKAAQGGLSFPPAHGGELGLCETIEPLPPRVPWWKRDGFTAPMAVLGLFAGVGLLVKLLTSL